jgi:hypothetical protein
MLVRDFRPQWSCAGAPTLELTGGKVAVRWPDVSQYSPTAPNGGAAR